MTFEKWFKKLKAEARKQGYAWLIADPESHQESFVDGFSPEKELDEQIYAASLDS